MIHLTLKTLTYLVLQSEWMIEEKGKQIVHAFHISTTPRCFIEPVLIFFQLNGPCLYNLNDNG